MSEVDERINRITSHRGVEALLIADSEKKVIKKFVRQNEKEVQNPQDKIEKYKKIVDLALKARSTVRDLEPLNDMTFLRIKSKKHEIMVAPDKDYFLIVVQNNSDKDEIDEKQYS